METRQVAKYAAIALIIYAAYLYNQSKQTPAPKRDDIDIRIPEPRPKEPARPCPGPRCPRAVPGPVGPYGPQSQPVVRTLPIYPPPPILIPYHAPHLPPHVRPCHFCDCQGSAKGRSPVLGGMVSPDGKVRALPLPEPLEWPHNIAARGLGCCGMRALDYAARFQGEPGLVGLPERLRADGQAGGAWPERIQALIRQYDPQCRYWSDTSKSHRILAAAFAAKKMPCVDYSGRDPHYAGSIAHCVNIIAYDETLDWAAILDNNYPATDQIVWMRISEFDARWRGWSYGLTRAAPGHCAEQLRQRRRLPDIADLGYPIYGLETARFLPNESAILNGAESSIDAIVAAIGPAMAPVRVDVDHRIDFDSLLKDPIVLGFVGGGLLLILLITEKKEGK